MQKSQNLHLSICSSKFAKVLFVISIFLFLLNLIGVYLKIYQGQNNFFSNGIYFFFNAAAERSVQTIFSTWLLLIASVASLVIGLMLDGQDATRKYWFALSIIFFYLGLDEALTIHEQFNKLGTVVNDKSGILHFAWILPYAGLVIVAGLFFFRFLLVLPIATRNLFIISGIIYVGAALGFEIVEGYIVANNGVGSHGDVLLPPIEEFLEMCAITLFIYATLRHAKQFQKEIAVRIA